MIVPMEERRNMNRVLYALHVLERLLACVPSMGKDSVGGVIHLAVEKLPGSSIVDSHSLSRRKLWENELVHRDVFIS